MKKILITLGILGLVGAGIASAQYYDSVYYGNYGTTNTYYGGYNNSYYGYGNAIGSYTIGCTTYYYNTRTGASMGQQQICNTTYTYPSTTYYQYQYTYPYTYTYPSTQSQYCTYGYNGGSWYPCYNNSWYGNYNGGYQNYTNCYYSTYGQYICY